MTWGVSLKQPSAEGVRILTSSPYKQGVFITPYNESPILLKALKRPIIRTSRLYLP